MRTLIAAVFSAGALVLLSGSAGARAVRPGTVTEIPLGASTQIYLFGLTSGPDGDLWFADQGCMGLGHCAIGRLTPQGRITTFARGLNGGQPPLHHRHRRRRRPVVHRQRPAARHRADHAQGHITEFSRGLRRGSQPFELTAGPEGDVWFTDQGRHPAIGRITPGGTITEFSRGLARGSVPFGIATGTDDQVWFTDRGCSGAGHCAVGRVTASGQIAELRHGLRPGAQPLGIAAGAGGEMWFADSAGAIGQVSPAGQITERAHGLRAGSSPVAVAAGPDGDMWFTDEGQTPAVGRITAGGVLREFSAGVPAGSEPAAIAPAADGKLWFTDEGAAAGFGIVTVGAPPAKRAAPRLVAAPRPGVPVTCAGGRFATWAGLAPSASAFRFDGFRWVRDGTLLRGHHGPAFTPAHHDAGARLACRQTLTYPAPLNVTVAADSPARRVTGSGSGRPSTRAPGAPRPAAPRRSG